MTDLFVFGTLRHAPLCDVVTGRAGVTSCTAHLPDHEVHWVKDEPYPMLVPKPGASAQGLVLRNLSAEDRARLDFYEGGFGYHLVDVQVETTDGVQQAQVYMPSGDPLTPGAIFVLDDWVAAWGEVSVGAAEEVMIRRETFSAEAVAQLLPFFRARAWARQIARKGAPQTLRSQMTVAKDVEITGTRPGFDGFFRLKPFSLRNRKFDGSMGPEVGRECFVSFDVALVLPYDPVADRVMLVEQMRYGPIHRGDPAPWVLEPVAGLIDAGETPEQAARRETQEEARLELQALLPISKTYPSPGYSTEFYHAFLGLCDLSARSTEQGGLASENEDIRNHSLPFEDALALIDTGEINTAPLAMMLLWLATRRDGLRKAANGG